MALNSPGVEVQVIDESFYVPAEPGTRPLLIVSTKENKLNGSGTGIAVGTLKANAGNPYLLTSQRDLSDIFGTPLFYTDSSQNPIHGGELNEYGLQAAYSYLGVSNSAYVVRSDLDLGQLIPSATAPSSNPLDGQYWFDTRDTHFGIFEWNGSGPTVSGGQKFANKIPTVITDITQIDESNDGAPLGSIGKIGDYAVVAVTSLNTMYYKNKMGDWVVVGSSAWTGSIPTIQATKSNPSLTAGNTMYINGNLVTVPVAPNANIAGLVDQINTTTLITNAGISAAVVNGRVEIYCTDPSLAVVITKGADSLIDTTAAGSVLGISAGTYYAPSLSIQAHTKVPQYKISDNMPRPTGSLWIKTTNVNLGANWRVKMWNDAVTDWQDIEAPVYASNEEAIYGLDRAGGGKNIATGTLYVQFNVNEDTNPLATFTIFRREIPDPTVVTSAVIDGTTFANGLTYEFYVSETVPGSAMFTDPVLVSFSASHAIGDAATLAGAFNAAMPDGTNLIASVDARNRLVISHEKGGDFTLSNETHSPLDLLYVPYDANTNAGTANLYYAPGNASYEYIVTNWKILKAVSSAIVPSQIPLDGALWYTPVLDNVDIMIHNGNTWVGYLDTTSPYYTSDIDFQTDPNGPLITATKPITQSDGSTLRNGASQGDSVYGSSATHRCDRTLRVGRSGNAGHAPVGVDGHHGD